MQYVPPNQVKQPYVIYQQPPVQRPGLLTRLCCCCCVNSGVAQRFNRWSLCAKLCCLVPCCIFFLAVVVIAALLIWTQVGIHGPNSRASSALADASGGNSTAQLEMYKSSYVFYPKNSTYDRALVFVPEYKVDPRAYAPIAKDLAEKGYLVGVVSPPLNFPPFAYGRVKDVVEHYNRPNVRFALGGHGVGANTAAAIAESRYIVDVRGLLLVAPLDGVKYDRNDLTVTYVYGTNDGWSTSSDVDKNRPSLPTTTTYVQVKDGNHGYFASMESTFGGDGNPGIGEVDEQVFVENAAIELFKKL